MWGLVGSFGWGRNASAPTAEVAAAKSSRSWRAMKLVSFCSKITASCEADTVATPIARFVVVPLASEGLATCCLQPDSWCLWNDTRCAACSTHGDDGGSMTRAAPVPRWTFLGLSGDHLVLTRLPPPRAHVEVYVPLGGVSHALVEGGDVASWKDHGSDVGGVDCPPLPRAVALARLWSRPRGGVT